MPSIKEIEKEYKEIINQLSDPELVSDWPASNSSGSASAGWEKFEDLSRRKKELDEIIEKNKELKEIEKRITENKTILSAPEDLELGSLAEEELIQLQEEKAKLEKELEDLLKGSDETEKPMSAIVEIRAGTGGDEAALFASDLYNMYSKYASARGWKEKVLDLHSIGIGGIKEIVFELKGDVYRFMKNEAGVHRVQRIPETEKSGRVHTSTATVAVLPRPKSTQMKIKTDELKIDYFRSSGPGGQNVNKRETAVRITHKPTGMVVSSQNERNQLANKENAMAILSARLLEKQQEEEIAKLGGKRKEQVGGAKRSEKIRTYNFPQDRVTDHRIKKSWHNIEDIMAGDLDKIIETLLASKDKF